MNIVNKVLIEMQKQGKNIFPLYTKQGLADRWWVNRQTVQNWSVRHADFCKPFRDIVKGAGTIYPQYEVERYEKSRGLNNE